MRINSRIPRPHRALINQHLPAVTTLSHVIPCWFPPRDAAGNNNELVTSTRE